MAGRVDSATHAASIAKISEAVKHELELRSHLDEIIKRAAFKGIHRSQAFLRHIVDHALHGEPADLRERSIGAALFGRLPAMEMVLRVSEQNEIGDSVELVACRKVTQHNK